MTLLIRTGRKEILSESRFSEIEVSPNWNEYASTNLWYRARLTERLLKSKKKSTSVQHMDPLVVYVPYTPPMITYAYRRCFIRPIPPEDLLRPEAEFEVGDVIDAAYKGGWFAGIVIKVLEENRRYLAFLKVDPDVVEFDRKELRPCFVWRDDRWYQYEKQELVESDFSLGKYVEVKIENDEEEVWAPGIALNKEYVYRGDDKLKVKYKSSLTLSNGDIEEEYVKKSFPYSKIRPSPPFAPRVYKLMEKVEALFESRWCPGKVIRVHSAEKYAVELGTKKEVYEFNQLELRPPMEWKDGVWKTEEKGMDTEEEIPTTTTTSSKRARVTLRATRSSSSSGGGGAATSLPAASNGGDVSETQETATFMDHTEETTAPSSFGCGAAAATSQNPSLLLPPPSSNGGNVSETELNGEFGSNMMVDEDAVMVMNGNGQQVTSTTEKATKVPSSRMLVLGVTTSSVIKQTIQKTSPRKKLQSMKNQKSSGDDTIVEKAPEEPKTRETVYKRKRGRPRKFISEPKQKIIGNGLKAVEITELKDITNDDTRPLSSWILGSNNRLRQQQHQPVSRTPDVVETPKPKEDTSKTIVLPFTKKSPLWKVLESMEAFKTIPQRPHFSPLLSSQEEFREGDAIGAMVMFTGLLEKLNNLQVDVTVSTLNRLNECFIEIEKHGFDISLAQSRIKKLIEIKEIQNWAMQELKTDKRDITEKERKKRKIDEDIDEISRKIVELQREEKAKKEARVAVEKEIVTIQRRVAVLDKKVQSVEMEFRATVAAPLK